MTKTSFTAVLALASLAVTTGCATGYSSRRVNPSADDDVGGTLIDSADVIAFTDKAAPELARALLASPKNNLVVAFPPIKNETVQPLNTAVFSDRLRGDLVRECGPRVKFVAREHLDEVVKERDAKRSGVFTGTERKTPLGADYLLTGRFTSLSKRAGGERADYFVLTLDLVDAEDNHIAWSDRHEFKKVGDAGVIYQ
jgi:TolB-like protein